MLYIFYPNALQIYGQGFLLFTELLIIVLNQIVQVTDSVSLLWVKSHNEKHRTR